MTEWVAVGGGFIAGDVVRWSDGDWKRRGARGHGKSVLVGNRIITAQVLKEADEKGMVCFKVVACKVGLSRVHRREVEAVRVGAEIRRAYKTIVKGKPERCCGVMRIIGRCCRAGFSGTKSMRGLWRWKRMKGRGGERA